MVGGEAGQGVQSVGFILAKVFARGGFHIFADQDYESRVRGGHNFYRIRVSDRQVRAISEPVDILLALNRESLELHRDELARGGVAVFDGEVSGGAKGNNFFSVSFRRLAEEKAGGSVMANTVAIGAALALLNYDLEVVNNVLLQRFGSGDKGKANIRAAAAGYEYTRERYKGRFKKELGPANGEARLLMNGNEALSLGAIAAGCTFMAAYPMTPSTSIMEYLAGKSAELGLALVQAEDEISAINMAIGAAFAGARAMTATSGSGFCLMVEGLGLSGITETPLVVVNAQRPGPAVGLPTRTEQGDLQFVLTAHHGEFPRVVLAPASVEDAFWLTVKAFNLAEKYQLPVIILTDHHLATSYATLDKFDISRVKIDRGELLSEKESNAVEDYKRHRVTASGISPRAVPLLGRSLVVTDSDEHDEAGHLVEAADIRKAQVLKRLRKLDGLGAEIGPPRSYGPEKARLSLIGWGSTYGALAGAVDLLRAGGIDANLLHISELWPFPRKTVSDHLERAERSFVVEGNATGQLARLIRSETGHMASGSILKFDGRPLTPAIITAELKKEVT
jgi:2-oxoglutarate ferredoxin oxidoreductase subunit alpha